MQDEPLVVEAKHRHANRDCDQARLPAELTRPRTGCSSSPGRCCDPPGCVSQVVDHAEIDTVPPAAEELQQLLHRITHRQKRLEEKQAGQVNGPVQGEDDHPVTHHIANMQAGNSQYRDGVEGLDRVGPGFTQG